jgi:hypothetical protein
MSQLSIIRQLLPYLLCLIGVGLVAFVLIGGEGAILLTIGSGIRFIEVSYKIIQHQNTHL